MPFTEQDLHELRFDRLPDNWRNVGDRQVQGPRLIASLLIQATKSDNDADRREATADKFAAAGDADSAAFYLGVAKQERDRAESLRQQVRDLEAPSLLNAAE